MNVAATLRSFPAVLSCGSINQPGSVSNAAAVNMLDSTGLATLDDVREELASWGVTFGMADMNSRTRHFVERSGLKEHLGASMTFPSAEAAVAALEASEAGKSKTSKSPATKEQPAVSG